MDSCHPPLFDFLFLPHFKHEIGWLIEYFWALVNKYARALVTVKVPVSVSSNYLLHLCSSWFCLFLISLNKVINDQYLSQLETCWHVLSDLFFQ